MNGCHHQALREILLGAALALTSLGAVPLLRLVTPALDPVGAWTFLAGGAYVVLSVCCGEQRAGRLAVPLTWLVTSLCISALPAGTVENLLMQSLLIAAVRLWTSPSGALRAVLDLALVMLAAGAAVFTFGHTGVLAPATWVYFLLLAAATLATSAPGGPARAGRLPAERFEHAYQQARAAIARLS